MDSDREKMKCIANRILALCKKLRIDGLKKFNRNIVGPSR